MTAHGHDRWMYVRTYGITFLALMVLTLLTVAVSYSHLVIPLAIAVALLIAIVKGTLVAAFFMHLLTERRPIFAVLILTGVLVAVLFALPLLTAQGQIGTPSRLWTVTDHAQTEGRR